MNLKFALWLEWEDINRTKNIKGSVIFWFIWEKILQALHLLFHYFCICNTIYSQKSAEMSSDPDVFLIRKAEIQGIQNSMKKLTLNQHTFRKENFGSYCVLDEDL